MNYMHFNACPGVNVINFSNKVREVVVVGGGGGDRGRLISKVWLIIKTSVPYYHYRAVKHYTTYRYFCCASVDSPITMARSRTVPYFITLFLSSCMHARK